MPNPTTPVLDTFVRANEDPLSGGGKWGAVSTIAQDRLVSNQAACTTSTTSSISQWKAAAFNADQEAYVTVPALGSASVAAVGVVCRQSTQPGQWTGYLLRIAYPRTTTRSNPLLPLLGIGGSGTSYPAELAFICRINGVNTRISTVGTTFTAGDRIWCQCVGSTIIAYQDANGGGFSEIVRWTDTQISSGGNLCLYFEQSASRATDFGGGNV